MDLGDQLSTLVLLHADKAKAYLNDVRQPLLDLTPKLEETRREVVRFCIVHLWRQLCLCLVLQVRNRSRELKEELEAAANKHQKMKQKYQQAAQTLERHQQKLLAAKSESLLVAGQKTYLKVCEQNSVQQMPMFTLAQCLYTCGIILRECQRVKWLSC